jgi:hypothetical protein
VSQPLVGACGGDGWRLRNGCGSLEATPRIQSVIAMTMIARLAVPVGIILGLIGLLTDWTAYLASPFAHALELWGFFIFAAGFGVSMYVANRAKSGSKTNNKV